jgi:hypothetical protein
MPSPSFLDLRVAPEVRARFVAFRGLNVGYEPTLCLMKTVEGKWTQGIYGPANIEQAELDLDRVGRPLLYEVDGLVVAIPQFQFLPELSGKMLTFVGNELMVVSRASGI